MSQLIENNFRKISNEKYIVTNRQFSFAIMGLIGFIIIVFICIVGIVELVSECGFSFWIFVIFSPIYIGGGGMFLLFIAMGLFTITTEIDLKTRTVRITRRNFRGQKATQEASLDHIRISALRIGVTDATPYGAWIVRAGFSFENEAGEDVDVAIWSKEVTSVKERNEIMFELYHFFFPNLPVANKNDIITNGTAVMLLSKSEKTDFEQEALFEKKPDENDGDKGEKK